MNHLTLETLNMFLDKTLPRELVSSVSDHLDSCPDCSQSFKKLSTARSFVRKLEPAHVPKGFAERTAARVIADSRHDAEWTVIEKTAEKVLAGLAFAVLLLWAVSSGSGGDQSDRSAGLLDVYIRDSSVVRLASADQLTRDELLAAAIPEE